ncbi:MAG: acyl carrier protein [Rhodospirillaceae bacterium]|jgi:acyl carrier protein|nr:acyl carrier protein [Rhodospirillaceae bacterium]|tara:strand:- start:3107 stop:3349 length:243 start_codon:yes stop_codon:yes gene_type:complete
MDTDIYSDLTEIFRQIFDRDDVTVGPETSAEDIAEWDSFNNINIVVATEERFGIRFNTAEVEAMQNAGDLARLVAEKTSA